MVGKRRNQSINSMIVSISNFQKTDNICTYYKQSQMSKSQQQFVQQKALLTTIYHHNRTKSNKFIDHAANIKNLVGRAKSLYHSNKLTQSLQYFKQAQRLTQQPNHQIHYLMGVIHMAIDDHFQAIKHFHILADAEQNYKGNTYMLLAICFNKLKDLQQAQKYITLQTNSQESIQGLFYFGKILLKREKYQEAIHKFKNILTKDPDHLKAKLLLTEIYQKTNNFEKCIEEGGKFIEEIAQLIKIKEDTQLQVDISQRINMLRVSCLVENHQILEAKSLISQMEPCLELAYWKAKISYHAGNINQYVLFLNECLSPNNQKTLIVRALSDLIILYMKQKDFYEAFHYANRSKYLKIQSKHIHNLLKQSEGMTFLMKKKFGQAILMIGSISVENFKESKENNDYLMNLFYDSMGYGYFSIGDHKTALTTYKKIKLSPQTPEQNQPYLYNICLCEGILAHEDDRVEEAIKCFEVSTEHLLRAEPYFYISVILVKRNLKEGASTDLFMKVLNIIDAGLKVGENCQMYYYRGLIYLYLGMNVEAIDDVDKAIEKSEDNVAKYFFLRALIFMHEKNYEQAISEFSTCISIDEKYFDAYLERAKAKILCGDTEGAFQDLENYPMAEEWKHIFYLYQGNYNLLTEEHNIEENILHTAHFQLGEFDKAGSAGKVLLAVIYKNYTEVITLLNEALDINFPIGCLEIEDILILKGYCYFCMENYAEAISNLDKAEEIVSKNENHLNYQEDEKKLLLIKINIIFVTLLSDQMEKAVSLCQILINDVYEGPIYDELIRLNDYLSKINQSVSSNPLEFKLFKSTNMISDYFPTQQYHGLSFKYYILFPRVKILDLELPQYQQPLIDFGIKEIENRPEAPWMKKDENGIIFTNEIQHFDGLNLQTQENQNDKTSKEKIKESLQLDADVVNKLEKLSKKGEN